jgi:integration host factor subunit beta
MRYIFSHQHSIERMMSLVRTDLVKRLAANHPDLPARDLETAVSSFFEAIVLQLADGGRVEIRGFGTFTTRAREPRTGRNPRTGDAVIVSASVFQISTLARYFAC